MGHPAIDNTSGYGFEATYALDEEARPVLVAIVKATFDILNGRQLTLAKEQPAPSLTGQLYGEDAETSSYRLEPELAFTKVATDCVLLGHAVAQRGATHVDVGFRAGTLEKSVRVFGERTFVRALGSIGISRPLPFDRIPLIWENAFGGKDASHNDPERTFVDLRNPVGRGFRTKNSPFEEGVALPNLEDPHDLISAWGHTPAPANFGFVSPGWSPRRLFGGTYDETWRKERCPLLPKDFDRRYWNSASAGLVARGLFRGDEPIQVVGAWDHGPMSFRLPGLPPPLCRVEIARKPAATPAMALDTVVVDADAQQVSLTYRAHAVLMNGPHDVKAISIKPGN
jgi:hypothetical protein